MNIRILFAMAIAAVLALLAAPTALAKPSDYNCATQIIDQTADQTIHRDHLKNVLMYAELIGVGDNDFMPYTQVPYMIRVFDDLPNGMSSDDYRDAWIKECGSYYQHLGDFKYRPYVLIVADQNGNAGIYSNVFVGDEIIDMVSVSTGRMRANIALGDIDMATAQAVDDISSILTEVKEAPTTQSDSMAQADNNAGKIILWAVVIIVGLAAAVWAIVWFIGSMLKRMP